MTQVRDIREEICEIGRRLYQQGLIVGRDGNVSYRLSDQEILCTPTGHCKGRLDVQDLCCVTLEGEQVGGRLRPSSEILLHLAILRDLSTVRAVIHSHPPHVLAYTLTHPALPRFILPEAEVALGYVPIVPYETPTTSELAEQVRPWLEGSSAIILAQHGLVTFAETLEEAFWTAEVLELYCRVLILAEPFGQISEIPLAKRAELERQRAALLRGRRERR